MERMNIEPGLLRIFRLFSVLEAIVLFGVVLSFEGASVTTSALPQNHYFIILIEAIALFFYLSLPWLREKLKQYYLPLALFIATVAPILSNRLYRSGPAQSDTFTMIAYAWELIPLLLVPLVLIAWQYSFKIVVSYSALTALLDTMLVLLERGGVERSVLPIIAVLFIRTISMVAVGYMVTELMTTQREQRKALTQANLKLGQYAITLEQLGISRERNRLARELHDTLAHTLSGIAVQLEAMKTILEPDQGEAQTMLDQTLLATRNGLTDTRRALKDLRATQLDDLGLSLALQTMARKVADRAGLQLECEIPDALDGISPAAEQAIYRITQEALENVVRHADARKVFIQLGWFNKQLVLVISDDGRGFDSTVLNDSDRLGMKGMQERAAMVGGELKVVSQPHQGTIIRFTLDGRHDKSFDL